VPDLLHARAEDICRHVVSTLKYEGGHWAGDWSRVEPLQALADRFGHEFADRYSDEQVRSLCHSSAFGRISSAPWRPASRSTPRPPWCPTT
jgi:hypothetical protein